jgi:hypothetical protein
MRGIYVRDHGIAWDGIVPIADGFVTVCDVRGRDVRDLRGHGQGGAKRVEGIGGWGRVQYLSNAAKLGDGDGERWSAVLLVR